jgi:hypothetical protein
MYIHDKKSGVILPLPFYLIWKYKVHLLLFGVVAQVVVVPLFLMVPASQQPSRNIESPWTVFHNRCIRDGIDPYVCQLKYPVDN